MEDTTHDLEILGRMLEALETTNDSELARFLGVSPQAVSKSRSSGKVPAPWPLKFAKISDISMDWLCFGRGAMRSGTCLEQKMPLEKPPCPQKALCSRCVRLEQRLETISDKLVETLHANVALTAENGQLKIENMKLALQVETAQHLCGEYAEAAKKADAKECLFDELKTTPSSEAHRLR